MHLHYPPESDDSSLIQWVEARACAWVEEHIPAVLVWEGCLPAAAVWRPECSHSACLFLQGQSGHLTNQNKWHLSFILSCGGPKIHQGFHVLIQVEVRPGGSVHRRFPHAVFQPLPTPSLASVSNRMLCEPKNKDCACGPCSLTSRQRMKHGWWEMCVSLSDAERKITVKLVRYMYKSWDGMNFGLSARLKNLQTLCILSKLFAMIYHEQHYSFRLHIHYPSENKHCFDASQNLKRPLMLTCHCASTVLFFY